MLCRFANQGCGDFQAAVAPMLRRLFLLILAGTFIGLGQEKTASMLQFDARKRVETPKGTGNFKVEFETVRWDPKKTAIIICDMWDAHWCKGASERVAEIAPRMNEVVQTARKRGVTIIHAPSETMEFYKDTPQRKRAQSAPAANPGEKIDRWKRIDTSKEPPLPIDD